MQLWRLRRARLQHPGYPCVPLMHGAGVPALCLAAGQLQEGCRPGLDGFPQLQTWWWPCVRGPVTPCAEMEPESLRAAHVGDGQQRGRAVHMALPRASPKGQKDVSGGSMCGDLRAAGNCSAELFPGSVPALRT